MLRTLVVWIGLGLLWAGVVGAQDFKIDAVHSAVTFKVSHLTVSKTNGSFKKFDGGWALDADSGKLKSLEVVMDVESVDTANKDRDDHLRNADFFDAKKHPKMTFKMDRYIEKSPGKGRVIGRLTMRGVTKPVELAAEVSKVVDNPFQKGKKKAGISLSGEVRRLDFEVGKRYGDAKIGETVTIAVDLEGEAVAYPYNVLSEVSVVADTVGSQEIVVFWEEGTTSALDRAVQVQVVDLLLLHLQLLFVDYWHHE